MVETLAHVILDEPVEVLLKNLLVKRSFKKPAEFGLFCGKDFFEFSGRDTLVAFEMD
jgi:hypothetical protein